MKNSVFKRILSIILVVAFLISVVPCMPVFAEESGVTPAETRNIAPVQEFPERLTPVEVTNKGDINYTYKMNDIALNYSNDNGWKVSGISSIDIPQFGISLPKLFLDGERLVFVEKSNAELWWFKDCHLRTQKDTFSDIISTSDYLEDITVRSKDGTIRYYEDLPSKSYPTPFSPYFPLKLLLTKEISTDPKTGAKICKSYYYVTDWHNNYYVRNIVFSSIWGNNETINKIYTFCYKENTDFPELGYSSGCLASGQVVLDNIVEGNDNPDIFKEDSNNKRIEPNIKTVDDVKSELLTNRFLPTKTNKSWYTKFSNYFFYSNDGGDPVGKILYRIIEKDMDGNIISPDTAFDSSTKDITTTYEAEDAVLGGEAEAVYDMGYASNNKQVICMFEDSYVEFKNVTEGNAVCIRYNTANTSGKLKLNINGKDIKDINFETTGGWGQTYKTVYVKQKISKNSTIKLISLDDDDCTNIDYIQIIKTIPYLFEIYGMGGNNTLEYEPEYESKTTTPITPKNILRYKVNKLSYRDNLPIFYKEGIKQEISSQYSFEDPVSQKNDFGKEEFILYSKMTEKNDREIIEKKFNNEKGFDGVLVSIAKYSPNHDYIIESCESKYSKHDVITYDPSKLPDRDPPNPTYTPETYTIQKDSDTISIYYGSPTPKIQRETKYYYDQYGRTDTIQSYYDSDKYLETKYIYFDFGQEISEHVTLLNVVKARELYDVKPGSRQRRSYEKYYYNNSLTNDGSFDAPYDMLVNTMTMAATNPSVDASDPKFRIISKKVLDNSSKTVKEMVSINSDGTQNFATYKYNNKNLLESVQMPNDTAIAQSYEYDIRHTSVINNKTVTTYDICINDEKNKLKTVTTYDAASRVIREAKLNNSNQDIYWTSYEYKQTGHNGVFIRSYDKYGAESIKYINQYGRVNQEKIKIKDLPDGKTEYSTVDYNCYEDGEKRIVETTENYITDSEDFVYPTFNPNAKRSKSVSYFDRVSNAYFTETTDVDGTITYYYNGIKKNNDDKYVLFSSIKGALPYEETLQNNTYSYTKVYYNKYGIETITDDVVLDPVSGNVSECTTTDLETKKKLTKTCLYDGVGNCTSIGDPVLGNITYNYNDDQSLDLDYQLDSNDAKISYEFDALNRMTMKSCTDRGGGNYKVEYFYDKDPDGDDHGKSFGNIVKIKYGKNGTNVDEFFYDVENQKTTLKRTIDGKTKIKEITTGYDTTENSSFSKIKYPDGEEVKSFFNEGGQLEKIRSVSASKDIIKGVQYNGKGLPQKITYGNDTKVGYDYDDKNRLKRINYLDKTDLTINYLEYTYMDNSNLIYSIGEKDKAYNQTFSYDALNRLKTAVNETYANYGTRTYSYDNFDNKLSSKVEFNGSTKGNATYTYYNERPMMVKSDGVSEYQYDNCGNMTMEIKDSKKIAYNYDCENRLTSVENITDVKKIMSAEYDYSGQRIKKIGSNGETTYYFFAEYQETYNKDGTIKSSAKKYYTFGSQFAMCIDNTIYYLYQDHLGSLRLITDELGKIAGKLFYAPDGELIEMSESNSQTEQIESLYTGQTYDEEASIYYYNSRYYKQSLGRFITPDTVNDGINRYAYCSNNPIMRIDPTGHEDRTFWEDMGQFFTDLGYAFNEMKDDERTWGGVISGVMIGSGIALYAFCPVLGEILINGGIEGFVYSINAQESDFSWNKWGANTAAGSVIGGIGKAVSTANKFAVVSDAANAVRNFGIQVGESSTRFGMSNYFRKGINEGEWTGMDVFANTLEGFGYGFGTGFLFNVGSLFKKSTPKSRLGKTLRYVKDNKNKPFIRGVIVVGIISYRLNVFEPITEKIYKATNMAYEDATTDDGSIILENQNSSASFYTNMPSGKYSVNVSYSAAQGQSSGMALYINDVKVKNVVLPATSDWSTFSVKTENAVLTSGMNKISLKVETASNPIHLNSVSVELKKPDITIQPYNTNPTNQDVTVNATTEDAVLNASSHTFTENGSFEFIATDPYGYTTSKTVTITNIDKVNPVINATFADNYKMNDVISLNYDSSDSWSGIATEKEYVKVNGYYYKKGQQAILDKSGANTIEIHTEDIAGNTATYTKTVQVSKDLSFKVASMNTTINNNSLYMKFEVTNNSTTSVPLSEIKMRYYYTMEKDVTQIFYSDYAAVVSGNTTKTINGCVTGSATKLSIPKTDANCYLEVGFTGSAGSLAPGARLETNVRINAQDWSMYNQLNDYSFTGSTTLSETPKITAYVNNINRWGIAPDSVTNLALNKSATASSIEGTGREATMAIDGNPATKWVSANSDAQYMTVDLGQVMSIAKTKLSWGTAYAKSYNIYTSLDGSSWTQVYSTTSGDGNIDEITFSPVDARYIKMQGSLRSTSSGYSLYEFEVFNK